MEFFESILATLLQPGKSQASFSLFDPTVHLCEERTGKAEVAQALNAAFLLALTGNSHPASNRAREFLIRTANAREGAEVAKFYLRGIELIRDEIERVCRTDQAFKEALKNLCRWTSNPENLHDFEETTEKLWSVFFPEATGIRQHEQERINALRAKRTVTITKLNPAPISDPVRQILFTSNALLTIPPASESVEELLLSDRLKATLAPVLSEPQLYWYDHPIPLGIPPEKNEALYGLRGLDAALEFEKARGHVASDARLACVLSISTTHAGLQGIAREYLQEEFSRSGGLKNIDAYALTEADAQRLLNEILVPAAEHYLQQSDAGELLSMFGVEGAYGRHYSFLKSIAAFWSVFIQREIRATFKIDLDQTFPQQNLVDETGKSAFEHFTTPLWGASGLDADGRPVELGMIAGALVNQRDIGKSLFTSDVPFPRRSLSLDEYIFFSTLPQALSTEAEMMARYNTHECDGQRTCLQRVHVTGGTNGILVESLRRHRPFTPSFFGRAEDQAYLLSQYSSAGPKLAYVHKDGLIMRHDKEALAREPIKSARVGKLIGDYVRILYFSAYARMLTDDLAELKNGMDPFTGCFVSRIPLTVVYLRFALKAAGFFSAGNNHQGLEFIRLGAQRITKALDYITGSNSQFQRQYKKERLGWNVFFDTLNAVEEALNQKEAFALELRTKARKIIAQCALRFSHGD